MSLKTATDEVFISFNHTNNYCCFGTSIGFYIYQINPFQKVLSRKIDGGVSMIKMLHESNIILFVGKTDRGLYPNNKLIIWDDHKKNVLGEISYNNKIISIDLTKNNIIVLCEHKIYIYEFESLTLVKSIDTVGSSNMMSIGSEETDFLIYPGNEKGTINITKLNSDYFQKIQAHTTDIKTLYLNSSGSHFVTASETGTLVRIFNTESGEKIKELRRGCDQTDIIDIKMSDDNSLLLVSSNKGTIHIYNTGINPVCENKNTLWENYGSSYIKAVLPVPEYFNSEWSFCKIYLTGLEVYSIIKPDEKIIYSFGNDGQFYKINFTDIDNPIIEKTIKYISDENDPFSERSTTIK
jgi:WD repeat-containing protein 45